MMDREQIDGQHLIPRYLAGQLSAAEEAAFEDFAARNPDIYHDIERDLRLKEGLAVLRDRGELDAVVRAPAWRSYTRIATAAVILVTCAAGLWSYFNGPSRVPAPPAVLASEVAGLQRRGADLPSLVGSYVLVRSRQANKTIDVQLPLKPGVIQLHIMPEELTARRYGVRLTRLIPGRPAASLGEVSGLTPDADSYVTLYVDTAALASGDYEISLSPQPAASADPPLPADSGSPDRFILRVP